MYWNRLSQILNVRNSSRVHVSFLIIHCRCFSRLQAPRSYDLTHRAGITTRRSETVCSLFSHFLHRLTAVQVCG